MQRDKHPGKRLRQLDLLPSAEKTGALPPQLPGSALRQVRQLLQKLLLELVDAARDGQGDADE